MKCFPVYLCLILVLNDPINEMKYTASTPANNTVREFLGISLTDSIDFIRWTLEVYEKGDFIIQCSYGIGKPNTNGFINENKVECKGKVSLENGIMTLDHDKKTLSMQVLNPNVAHLLNKDARMMVGNAGWSYSLNATRKVASSQITFQPKNIRFSDSIVFEGRTPCRGIEELLLNKTRSECYKKKWLIRLNRANPSDTRGTYATKNLDPETGTWTMKADQTGKIIYQLHLKNGNMLNLWHMDENLVYIMDSSGDLMVGDLDFSYSLNRRAR